MYREEPTEVTLTIASTEIAYDETGSQEDRQERVCPATCYHKGEKLYLQYETEEDGAVTKSMLVITPDELVVRRKGALESRLQFRRGLTYSFLYHTPYGDVPLTVATKELTSEISEKVIKIHLAYDILSQNEVVSYHQMLLEARAN
ncbi:MAG: DUF1934 domain-containing protein [Lachnospiraceae bacterium]|nr:DUF1934 domain-containing protein [Lachnospiraceae bacterium]